MLPIDVDIRLKIEMKELERLEAQVKDSESVLDSWNKKSNELAQKRKETNQALRDSYKELDELEKNKSTIINEQLKITKNVTEAFKQYEEQLNQVKQAIEAYEKELSFVEKDEEEIGKRRDSAKEDLREITKQMKEQQDVVKKLSVENKKQAQEEAAIARQTEKQNRLEEKRRKDEEAANEKRIRDIRREAAEAKTAYRQRLIAYEQTARGIAIASRNIAAIGTGLLTGAVAMGQNYINKTDDKTQLTERWTAATKKFDDASLRIGKVVAKELLPAIEKGAELVGKFADFVEQNPEMVKKGLQGIAAVTTLASIVGTMATTAQVVLRAMTILQTVEKTSAALGVGKTAAGVAVGGATSGGSAAAAGGATALSAAAPAVGILIAGAFIVELERRGLNYIMGSDQSWSDLADNVKKSIILPFGAVLNVLNQTGNVSDDTTQKLWDFAKSVYGLNDVAEDAADSLDAAANSLGKLAGSANEKAIVDAYANMLEEEEAATAKYAEDQKDILDRGRKQEIEIIKKSNEVISRIRSKSENTLLKLATDYMKNEKVSLENYSVARMQVARQGGEEIVQIEKDHQEQLRRLMSDHYDRADEFVRARDALGLVKEQRSFEKQRRELENNANKEIAERRKQTAQRLRDMAVEFAAERKQRLEEYQEKVKEENERKKQAIIDENKRRDEELKVNREKMRQALQELRVQYESERKHRRDAFIAMVRDLDASLLGEQRKKQQYYSLMLRDAEAFLAAYRRKMPSGGNITTSSGYLPNRDMGGYMDKGLYEVAKNGVREYVMDGPTTKAAEKMLGGQITHQKLLSSIGGSGGKSITVHQNLSFSGEIGAADKAEIRKISYDSAMLAVKDAIQ